MFRVIDVAVDPAEVRGPEQERSLPSSVHALGEEVVTIIESTGEHDMGSCGCGSRIGEVLDDSDDCHPFLHWGAYTIWSDGEGLYRVLCEECSEEQALAG